MKIKRLMLAGTFSCRLCPPLPAPLPRLSLTLPFSGAQFLLLAFAVFHYVEVVLGVHWGRSSSLLGEWGAVSHPS